MAIVLKKIVVIPSWMLSIIDTIEVYVDDVLVASASDESGIQWAVSLTESQSFLNGDAYAVITLTPGEPLALAALASYLPTITEGPSSGAASVILTDVTLYIPTETINISMSAPVITDAYYGAGGSAFGAASVIYVSASESASVTSYAPTISITEGGSVSASAGLYASVTIF